MANFLSDLFGGAGNAAQAQQQAMMQGLGASQNNANSALNALQTTTNQALPYFQSNWNTAQGGVSRLEDLLGLNGPAGSQNAQAALATMPGYQFTLGQGNNAINAAAAANGTLGSGNQALALQKYGQGLAQQNYGNYVNQLMPFLNLSSNTAGGIGNLYSNLGANEAGVYNNLNKNELDLISGYGNAQANADIANQGLGQSLLGNGLRAGASLLGTPYSTSPVGATGPVQPKSTSLLSQLASGLAGGIGSLFTFSDERLKEDIEPVGELFDGSKIYRYNYKGDDRTHIGLLAQEVAETKPEAVADFGGFLAVDYGRATDYASELAGFLEDA